ncbi:MAG TPA: nuclear transport factor 2 family protein [Gaiellaceae bacterium]|nr:nuclear transport factor 2 family protein [Gaiellaceae bacterium]
MAGGPAKQTVERVYHLARRSDHRQLRELIADDATWHPAKEGAWNPCVNADQIVRTLLWRTTMNRMRPAETIELGDRVVLHLRGTRLGRLGGTGFFARLFQIVVVRDGKVVSMQDYQRREDAYAAAGLRP